MLISSWDRIRTAPCKRTGRGRKSRWRAAVHLDLSKLTRSDAACRAATSVVTLTRGVPPSPIPLPLTPFVAPAAVQSQISASVAEAASGAVLQVQPPQWMRRRDARSWPSGGMRYLSAYACAGGGGRWQAEEGLCPARCPASCRSVSCGTTRPRYGMCDRGYLRREAGEASRGVP